MKQLAMIVVAAGLLGWAPRRAQAQPIYTTYNFNFAFDPFAQPGATASGFVTTEQDGSNYSLSQWNVVVAGLVDNGVAYGTVDFNNNAASASGSYDPSDPLFHLLQADPLELEWQTYEDFDDGGSTQLLLDGFFKNDATGFGAELQGGSLMIATPEPATWTLLGGGMLALLGLGWRRRVASGK
jgi:hypothetical protein